MPNAACYMAYVVIYGMYKLSNTTLPWCDLKYAQMKERFDQGLRYDAVGKGGPDLSQIDQTTRISSDIEDEEVMAFADHSRTHMIPMAKTFSVKFARISCWQNCYAVHATWDTLVKSSTRRLIIRTTETYYPNYRDQTPEQMHANCYSVLGTLIGKVTGRLMCTLRRALHDAHERALCIDPVDVIMRLGVNDAPIQSITMMVNVDIRTWTD